MRGGGGIYRRSFFERKEEENNGINILEECLVHKTTENNTINTRVKSYREQYDTHMSENIQRTI